MVVVAEDQWWWWTSVGGGGPMMVVEDQWWWSHGRGDGSGGRPVAVAVVLDLCLLVVVKADEYSTITFIK